MIVGVHNTGEKIDCGRHIGHRKETRGLSVGSDRVDTTKIPGMQRKHGFPGSQTREGMEQEHSEQGNLQSLDNLLGNLY